MNVGASFNNSERTTSLGIITVCVTDQLSLHLSSHP